MNVAYKNSLTISQFVYFILGLYFILLVYGWQHLNQPVQQVSEKGLFFIERYYGLTPVASI